MPITGTICNINTLHLSLKTNTLYILPRSNDFIHILFLKQEKNYFHFHWYFLQNVFSGFLLQVYFYLSKVEYHPFQRPQELVDYCRSRNIVFEGYCPLAKGEALNHPTVTQLAKKYGRTPAQICIRWSIQVMENGNKNVATFSGKKCRVWGLCIKPEFIQEIFLLSVCWYCVNWWLYWKFRM